MHFSHVVPRKRLPMQGVDHEWKHAFFTNCLTPILSAVVAVQPPDYAHIIALDYAARDFGVPDLLDEHRRHVTKPGFLVTQRGLVTMSREIGQYQNFIISMHATLNSILYSALLQLHRKYCTEALSGPTAFNFAYPYAPSVFAAYLSAARLIKAVETIFSQEQQLSVRFLHFWFNSFSATVRRLTTTSRTFMLYYLRIDSGSHAGTADLPRTSDAACGVRVSRAREGIPIVQIGGEDTSVQQQGPGACAAPVNL